MPSGFYSTKDISGVTIAAQDIDNRFTQLSSFCTLTLSGDAQALSASIPVTGNFNVYDSLRSIINISTPAVKGFTIPSYAKYAQFYLNVRLTTGLDTSTSNCYYYVNLLKNNSQDNYVTTEGNYPKDNLGPELRLSIVSPIQKVTSGDIYSLLFTSSINANITLGTFQCVILG